MLTTKNVFALSMLMFAATSSLSSAQAASIERYRIHTTHQGEYRAGKVDPYTDSWSALDSAI
jgi:hypothetical protein